MNEVIDAIIRFEQEIMRETAEYPVEIVLGERTWFMVVNEWAADRLHGVPANFAFKMRDTIIRLDPVVAKRITENLLVGSQLVPLAPANPGVGASREDLASRILTIVSPWEGR